MLFQSIVAVLAISTNLACAAPVAAIIESRNAAPEAEPAPEPGYTTYGKYASYGTYQPPAAPKSYTPYANYGSYKREPEADVQAAPVEKREAAPEAAPEPIPEPNYQSYGKYASYGTYQPPAAPKSYAPYASYGSYKREPEADVQAAPVEKREAAPEAAPEPDYKSYGKYASYGTYQPPAAPKSYAPYATYGSYKREPEADAAREA